MPEYNEEELKTLIEEEIDQNYEQFVIEPHHMMRGDSATQMRDDDPDVYYTLNVRQNHFFGDILEKLNIVKSQREKAFKITAIYFKER